MENSRLVYSTETGPTCPKCEKPASKCTCKKNKSSAPKKHPKKHSTDRGDGVVRIQRETKGRKGKAVTVVAGLPLEDDDLQDFAKALKSRCGAGGSVKEGVILIQGDHRETLLEEIKKQGYTAKLSGG